MGSYVFANGACVVWWNGQSLMLTPGQPWPEADPFVVARPEFFDDDPPNPAGTMSPEERKAQPPKKVSDKDVNAWLAGLSKDKKKALAQRLLVASEQE